MATSPSPLLEGTVLSDRYHLRRLLGQGGFGITYEAHDTTLDRLVVIKELAPFGTSRDEFGTLSFHELSPAAVHRLRAQFQQEGAILARLKIQGIIRCYESFQQFGTAFLVLSYVPDALTLEKICLRDGPMDEQAMLGILDSLLQILGDLHREGVLHRDIKPSNILIDSAGNAYLIDLGSARQWHSDLTQKHTVEFTPGYAPIEQLSDFARRGPGTDLYSLAASAYHALTGTPPITANDRAAGIALESIGALRPDLKPATIQAIDQALAFKIEDRPRNAFAMAELLFPSQREEAPSESWEKLDQILAESSALKPDRFECPSCSGPLVQPRPQRFGTCIVCREGRIQPRAIENSACPICRAGFLRPIRNIAPLAFCPRCRISRLRKQGVSLPWQAKKYACEACQEQYSEKNEVVTELSSGKSHSWNEWRDSSGRQPMVHQCDTCKAQFDDESDGRRLLVFPVPKPDTWQRLYPEEWGRVALGLEPGVGNATCEHCFAEYFQDKDHLTLLDADQDPYDVLTEMQGRLLTTDQARWIAAGKWSGNEGFACDRCHTEFDSVQDGERLFSTSNESLEPYMGQVEFLSDWHRLSRGLPRESELDDFEQQLIDKLHEAFCAGELVENQFWNGRARAESKEAKLVADQNGIHFGAWLRKEHWPWSELLQVRAISESEVILEWSDATEHLNLDPTEISLQLESGRRTLVFTAIEFAGRCQTEIEKTHQVDEQ